VTLLEPVCANDDGDAPQADGKTRRGSLAEAGETLGHRKMLARTATGTMLQRVLDDPHPDVIQNALQNPGVTDDAVVRLSARRPIGGSVLEMVARSRFQNSGTVRRAIVLNPDCPQRLAIRLIGSMTPTDLYDVVHAPGLHKDVKAAARRLMDSR
jgi:hypothetical protein